MTSVLELVTALRLAGPELAAALARRFRAEVEEVVADQAGLAVEVVRRVLDGGDGAGDGFDVVGYFREGPGGGPYTTDLFVRAARLGDPATAAGLYRRRERLDPAVTAAVLANVADPLDDEWYVKYGLVDQLRTEARFDPTTAARLPFAALVYTAAADRCAHVPYAVAVDLCVAVADRGTPDDLRALAKEDLGHDGLAALLIQAARSPSPSAFLADARPPEEWTDAAAVRAYARVRAAGGRIPEIDERPPLDWDLVRADHARSPLGGDSLACLSAWEDCPDDLLAEGLRRNAPYVVRMASRLPFDIVHSAELERWPSQFAHGLRRGIAEGWMPVDRVLAEGRSAHRMLSAVVGAPEARDALNAVFAPLGEDPELWLTLYAKLPRFAGSATDLVAEVLAAGKRTTKWPRPLAPVFPATEPENTRALFLTLIRHMPDEVTIALAPHLDARAVQHLLVFHDLPEPVRDALVAAHGTTAPAAYAASYRLSAAEVEWLLDRDEPAVDAMLFAHGPLPYAERVRILSGIRRDGGRVRVADEVLEALGEVNLGHYRSHVTAGIGGGDPGVAKVILGRLRLGTAGGRLRLVIGVWERYGPDAVRELLVPDRLPATTLKAVAAALDAPDGAGLARLRDRLAAEEAPQRLVAQLAKARRDPAALIRRFEQEGVQLPWPELLEAAKDDRLPLPVIAALAEHAGCPRDFALETLAAHARAGEQNRTSVKWREQLLRRSTMTPADLLRQGTRPADYLPLVARRWGGQDASAVEEPCAEARELTTAYLGDDLEAWTVAVRLFPEFAGTLPELLATARAAVA
jgi:hypothetical protein